MSLARCCCRLRRPCMTTVCAELNPLRLANYSPRAATRTRASICSTVTRRHYTASKPPASESDAPSSSKTVTDKAPSSSSESSTQAAGSPLMPVRGSLAQNSIFQQEAQRLHGDRQTTEQNGSTPTPTPRRWRASLLNNRDPKTMAAVLDPTPRARIRFERRMVIQELRRRGRLTKEQSLKRTERQYVRQSEFYKTGMKKVAPLARQIAGKTIEDAIVQMQFSKKKAATWIRDHLIATRNRAVVERGMGLGAVEPSNEKAIKIELKDGSKHNIKDRTGIYIDQAWVNKGPYGRDVSKRARGRIDQLRLPQTAITIQLKEEATRIREWKERVAKEERKKPWVQLPNKPISAQRPYYSW